MTFPQLRIRSAFSFRDGRGAIAFGPLPAIAARLAEIGCPAAGLVDVSTWGHTRWAKTAQAPLFGVELGVPLPDGRRPAAWALAGASSRDLYRFSSAARKEGADRIELFRAAAGKVLRFAGAALTDPECFDYVDINPASARAAMAALRLADSTGKPLVITSDNSYPASQHKSAFLAIGGREAVTPQHILDLGELWAALGRIVGRDAFDCAVRGTHEAAAKACRTLDTAPIISVPGDLRAEVEAGRQWRLEKGHIAEWTDVHAARVARELELIESKQYQSYFLVVADLVRWAKTRMLVGPGRGSSAGSLVCYLLRITEVNPLEHDLLFERFIDVTRNDLPDIDIDFNDTKRDMVFAYLADKYGASHVARLGNIITLKPRSAIAEVGKRLGIPPADTFDLVNVLVSHPSGDERYGRDIEDTIDGTAAGRAFIEKHPAARVMTEIEGHGWHTGVHAAGVVVCNDPISDFATVGADGIAHIDKPAAETLGLLKIDALGLTTLGVIEDAGVVDAETLYGLKLDDPEVFGVLNDRKFSGIFQFEGSTQRGISAQIDINAFRRIDHVTALARPGPLGGGAAQRYINRAAGRERVTYTHASLAPYLAPTLGVILYQEQVMRICAEVGGMTWEQVAQMRKAISRSKGREFLDQLRPTFIAGAMSRGISVDTASDIWEEINTFGGYGMNASHTVSYGIVSYWCAFMKRYHPLAYAAACLRGAGDDERATEILREMVAEDVQYMPFDVDRSESNWTVVDGELIGGFQNVRGIGAIMAAKYVSDRNAGTLTDKQRAKIAKLPVAFVDLRPAHSKWGALYADPEAAGVQGRIEEFATLPEHGRNDSAVTIGLVKKRVRRDRNESTLIKRRNGAPHKGQPLFLDVYVVDDSVSKPVIARINERMWEEVGQHAANNLRDDEDWLLMRGRWLKEFNMLLVTKVRCLTRPEALLP
jgi:hypothetical protein